MARVTTLIYTARGKKPRTTTTDAPTVSTVRLPLVSNAQTFYSPTIEQDGLILLPLLTNEQEFFGPVISPAPLFISPPLLANTQVFFPPTVNQTIQLPLVSNDQTFYEPQVVNGQTVVLPLVTNTQTFYGPQVNQRIDTPLLTNTQTFYDLDIRQGATIILPLVANAQTFYGPQLNQRILAPLLTNTQTFYGPTVTAGQVVRLSFWANGQAFYPPKVNQKIVAGWVNNTQTFYGPVVSTNTLIVLPRITNTQTFYGPSVNQKISLPLLTNTSTVFPPVIVPDLAQVIDLPLTTNTQTFYGPTLKQSVRLPLFTNTNTLFGPSVSPAQSPGFALSTPTATVTSAAGDPLEVSIAMGADIWAGYKLRIQRSLTGSKNVSDGSYVSPTLNIVHFVVDSEVAALAITNADMVIDGYIDPSGAGFQQYRWERDDGAISNWSEISYNVTASAAVFATVNGPNRSDRLNLPTSANNLRISNNDWGAPYKARLTLPGADAGQFESTQEAWANSSDFILIGIDDGSYDFDNVNEGSIPGNTGLTRGVSLRIDASGGYSIYRNGSFQSGALSYPVGSTTSVVSRKSAGTVTFYTTPPNGSPTLLATISGQSWMASGYYGFGGATRADTHRFNCGATSFVKSLGVGEVKYG
jgi:hypothetical protein